MLKALILAIITFLFNTLFLVTFMFFLLLTTVFTADVYNDKPSDFVYGFTDSVFDELPKCSEESSYQELLTSPCLPAGVSKTDFQSVLRKNVDLGVIDEFAMQVDPFFGQPILSRNFMWIVFWGLFLIEMLLLVVGALVIHRPWHSWLRWIGKALASGAITVFVMFLVGYFGGDWLMEQLADSSPAVGSIVNDLYKGIIETAFIYAGILLAIGLLLYGWAIYGKRNDF